MTKSDLRTGMTVVLRNGYKYSVDLTAGQLKGKKDGWMPLSDYDENLVHLDDRSLGRDWDVVEITLFLNSPRKITIAELISFYKENTGEAVEVANTP